MGIEIRQLVVKSDVVDDDSNGDGDGGKKGSEMPSTISECELASIREDVLEECKEWLMERQVRLGER
jgi:hypothetical protein